MLFWAVTQLKLNFRLGGNPIEIKCKCKWLKWKYQNLHQSDIRLTSDWCQFRRLLLVVELFSANQSPSLKKWNEMKITLRLVTLSLQGRLKVKNLARENTRLPFLLKELLWRNEHCVNKWFQIYRSTQHFHQKCIFLNNYC